MTLNMSDLTSEQLAAVVRHVNHHMTHSPYLPYLVAYVKDVLDDLSETEGETWLTRDLVAAMAGEPHPDRQCKARMTAPAGTVTNALHVARKSDQLAGCWHYHPTKRHMGNPLIVWTATNMSPQSPVRPTAANMLPPLPPGSESWTLHAGMPKLKGVESTDLPPPEAGAQE